MQYLLNILQHGLFLLVELISFACKTFLFRFKFMLKIIRGNREVYNSFEIVIASVLNFRVLFKTWFPSLFKVFPCKYIIKFGILREKTCKATL
jgi:hypothetical protein